MSADFLDALFRDPSDQGLPDGWTGWVTHAALPIPTAKSVKDRPWCRGRSRAGSVEWFPRTSKPPWEGTRWAVHSPAGHFPGLTRPGWFVVNAYTRQDQGFNPKGDELGVLGPEVLDLIYERLNGFYWDSGRGR